MLDLPGGSTLTLSGGRRNYYSPACVPTPSASPLSRPSGYSRRGDRSPRLCCRTVRESFPSHGSSVIRPLSWAPCRACDLYFGASPSRVIHTSLDGVLTASAALLIPITYLSPSPRQPIRWLSQRPSLLGESYPVVHPVDTSSSLRALRGYAVPHLRLSLKVGPHSSPGFSGMYPGRLQTRPALILALWPKPIIRVGLSHLTTIQPWIRLPVRVQLSSTGFPVGFRVTACYPRSAD
jgi:hypothetical protein